MKRACFHYRARVRCLSLDFSRSVATQSVTIRDASDTNGSQEISTANQLITSTDQSSHANGFGYRCVQVDTSTPVSVVLC
jgi:hypothetical protein